MEINASNQSNMDSLFHMSTLERALKFYLLLILQVPSLCCTIFMLYHFKWNRLHSQIYGFLIICNGLIVMIELPMTLLFLHEGAVRSTSICSAWITINYSLFVLSIASMAWTSIERYLFIYHERMISRHSILLHYFPIGCIIVYTPLFYLSTVVWYTCEPYYDVQRYVCGGACYQYELALGLIDWIGNVLFTVMITFVVNIIIIIRHFIQKHRMKRTIVSTQNSHRWRRSVKLSVQLFATSMLYIIGWIPYTTIGLIQIFENTDQLSYLLSTIFVFIPYIQTLFLPFICLLFMPESMQKLRTIWMQSFLGKIFRQTNQIQMTVNPRQTMTMNTLKIFTIRPPVIN